MATLTNIEQVIVERYKNLLTEREDDFYGRVVNIASVGEDEPADRDSKKHKLVARIAASKELRELPAKTPVHVPGEAPDSSVINSITDVASDKERKDPKTLLLNYVLTVE
jgi:hypothetical protein